MKRTTTHLLAVLVLPLVVAACHPGVNPPDDSASADPPVATEGVISLDDLTPDAPATPPPAPEPADDPAPATEPPDIDRPEAPTEPEAVEDEEEPSDPPVAPDDPGQTEPDPPAEEPPVDPPAPPPVDPAPTFTGCEGDSDAHDVFNAMWTVLDAEYAVFDARLPATTSWATLGAATCASITPFMADADLFDVLIGLARNLDDGHVTLAAEALGREESAWTSAYPHYPQVESLEFIVQAMYLDTFLSWSAEDWFSWGRVGNIGYISITSLDWLSPSGEEAADRAAANAAMDLALAALGTTSGLVVDVRANEGGWDSVALDVAARFAGAETVAWSEQRRAGAPHDVFTAWDDVNVGASVAGAYEGPVVLLTSRGTFSAAETFVLAMRERDNVTVMGERTSGHLSDIDEAALPNGWTLTFSGERYRAADGELYEGVGVPVDVPVTLDVTAIDYGLDPMFVAAVQRLTN